MTFLDIFVTRNANNSDAEVPAQEDNEVVYSPFNTGSFLFGSKYSGKGALSLSPVFSAVSLISNSIAELPINIRDCSTNDRDIIKNHAITNAINGGLLNKFNLMKQVMHDLLLYGNAFIYIYRAGDEITGLRYLSKGNVTIHYTPNTNDLYYLAPYVSEKKILPADMIHLSINGEDGVQGKGILFYADRSVKTSDSTEKSAEDFFSSGCNISGVLKINGPATDKQKQDAKKNWEMTYGKQGTGGVAVLPADMDYQPVAANAADSQMVESRQWNLTDLARFFNISPVMLGDLTHSSYSTIEASNIQYLTTTLQPYISLIEAEFNRKLCTGIYSNVCVDLDESYILMADKSTLSTYYSTLVEKGILTVNEARKKLGYPEMPGCDDLHVAYSDVNQNKINSSEDIIKDNNIK